MRLRHYFAILLSFTVLAGVAVTVYLDKATAFGAMEVRALSADGVQIHRGNEVIEVGQLPQALQPQDLVVTTGGRNGGLAELNLESEDRTVLLQRGTRLRIRSSTVVETQQGSVLASASDAPMEVRFDDVTARFSSATFRVDRGVGSVRAASYDGSVRLSSPGEEPLEVDALFQVHIAAGDLPMEAVPYRIDAGDAWDIEYLESALDLNQQLDPLVRGFARQVGERRPGLDYFRALTGADVSFMRRYLSRPVGDLFVAFSIAENDPDSSFKAAFKRAMAFLDAGASYGVAAMILDVRADNLVAQLKGLILDTGAVASDGGAGEASFVLGSSDGGSGPGTDGGSDESTGSVASGEVEGESEGDVGDCTNAVDCTVQDVQDLPPGPAPGGEEEEEPPGTDTLPGTDGDGGLLDGGLGDL